MIFSCEKKCFDLGGWGYYISIEACPNHQSCKKGSRIRACHRAGGSPYQVFAF